MRYLLSFLMGKEKWTALVIAENAKEARYALLKEYPDALEIRVLE